MGQTPTLETQAPTSTPQSRTLIRVLAAASFCHLLNDMMQSLLPSIYPILKSSFHLDFSQIGFITPHLPDHRLAPPALHRPLQTDRHPQPYSLCPSA